MEVQEFKIIKLSNGEDIVCRLLDEDEYTVFIERPITLVHKSGMKDDSLIHTGFNRWVSFTSDVHFEISKNKILTMGNLSAEMRYFYKILCSKLVLLSRFPFSAL